jgi:hypothetical protein
MEKVPVRVMKYEKEEREVEVAYCTYRTEERKGTRMVCELVKDVRVVDVPVMRPEHIKHEGKRKQIVCEWVKDKQMVTECYLERVPYEMVVRVPVSTVCYTPVSCDDGGRRGLFSRLFGGCR